MCQGWDNVDGSPSTWKLVALAHLEPHAIINSFDKNILTTYYVTESRGESVKHFIYLQNLPDTKTFFFQCEKPKQIYYNKAVSPTRQSVAFTIDQFSPFHVW